VDAIHILYVDKVGVEAEREEAGRSAIFGDGMTAETHQGEGSKGAVGD
jgi:hypothetical protein